MKRAARIPDRTLWIDGRLCRGEQATLSLFDRGARDGEGLFETLRTYGGRPFQWEKHMERLVLSAAELGFPVPTSPTALREGLSQVLAAAGLVDAVARITVTRGIPGGRPTLTSAWIEADPLPSRLWAGTRSGAATVIVSQRPFEPGPLGAHKTTSRLAYHLAREEARVARADEALLVNSAGNVLEGAVSNVFAVIRNELLTPPLSAGILPGIVRSRVMQLAADLSIRAREWPLTLAELSEADEVFLTNSAQEVVPVGTLDERTLPGRKIAGRLLAAYRAEVAAG